jgi:hypothetical protein
MARGLGKTIKTTNRKRPGRHSKKPNKHKVQATRKKYQGQGRV